MLRTSERGLLDVNEVRPKPPNALQELLHRPPRHPTRELRPVHRPCSPALACTRCTRPLSSPLQCRHRLRCSGLAPPAIGWVSDAVGSAVGAGGGCDCDSGCDCDCDCDCDCGCDCGVMSWGSAGVLALGCSTATCATSVQPSHSCSVQDRESVTIAHCNSCVHHAWHALYARYDSYALHATLCIVTVK